VAEAPVNACSGTPQTDVPAIPIGVQLLSLFYGRPFKTSPCEGRRGACRPIRLSAVVKGVGTTS
jgi:hypothetical protein